MPAHEPEQKPQSYKTPSMSALLASCAAADAVSRPPESSAREEAEPLPEPPVPAQR
ncbi:hypothetical protein [Streptomyces sp. NPDC048172]|uniref:hypothetical protein n=1 Tax=Streptomyces sp. NPDC048172 TaxID=3365505 RepID=UPI00371E7467